MSEARKPVDVKSAEPIAPDQMSYPTPELDPATGAPLDTRFQNDASQEVVASTQTPKSEAAKAAKDEEEDYDEGSNEKAAKAKEKPRHR